MDKHNVSPGQALPIIFIGLLITCIVLTLIYLAICSTKEIQIPSVLGLIAFGLILILRDFKEIIIKLSGIQIRG